MSGPTSLTNSQRRRSHLSSRSRYSGHSCRRCPRVPHADNSLIHLWAVCIKGALRQMGQWSCSSFWT
jgi:hypothetical protein